MDTISKQYQDNSSTQYEDDSGTQYAYGSKYDSKLYQDGYEGGGAPWES
ncbi:hypothetical protein [Streptomyces sp. NPDC001530]